MIKRTNLVGNHTIPRLTNELRNLTRRYEGWWNRWATDQDAHDKPNAPVFHYTSWDGFRGIMQSESFWLHSIFCMNDKTELDYGWNISRDLLLQRNLAAHLSSDELVKVFCAPQLAADRRLWLRQRFDFYSISFGVRDDDRQWCTYGDKRRGVAVGLKPHLFSNVSKPAPAPEDKVYMARVLYGSSECTERHRLAIDFAFSILEEARQRGLVRTDASGLALVRTVATLMNVPLIWNSVTTKCATWRHEKELRMLATNDLTRPHLPIRRRDDGRSYIVIPMPLRRIGSISEIMVGADADGSAENEVRRLLNKWGVPDVPVNRGTTPSLRR